MPLNEIRNQDIGYWRKSVLALAIELNAVAEFDNLMTDKATERGEIFLADSTIPQPRPSTIFAWSSLCCIGPVNGFRDYRNNRRIPYNPLDSTFVIPFLPKILPNEDTRLSLARTSKAHVKNSFGEIRWGSIWIASSGDGGRFIETLSRGDSNSLEWANHRIGRNAYIPLGTRIEIPPLFAAIGEGWQFGIIQRIDSWTFHLREAFTGLAANGIPETLYMGEGLPTIRRLMFRFLNQRAAENWARAFATALQEYSPEVARDDFHQMIQEIQKRRLKNQTKTENKNSMVDKMVQDLTFVNGFDSLYDTTIQK